MKFLCGICFCTLALAGVPDKPLGSPEDDLARLESEPNLEKRARGALDNAVDALKEAETAYKKADLSATGARLREVQQSVELVEVSLKQTGKNPSRSPKNFKHAEMKTRGLLRRLDGFRDQMSVVDRPMIEPVITKIQQVHDTLLDGIMGKRK